MRSCMDDVTESRTWGQEAKQRPRRDDAMSAGLVIIADPTQTALCDVIRDTTPCDVIMTSPGHPL